MRGITRAQRYVDPQRTPSESGGGIACNCLGDVAGEEPRENIASLLIHQWPKNSKHFLSRSFFCLFFQSIVIPLVLQLFVFSDVAPEVVLQCLCLVLEDKGERSVGFFSPPFIYRLYDSISVSLHVCLWRLSVSFIHFVVFVLFLCGVASVGFQPD